MNISRLPLIVTFAVLMSASASAAPPPSDDVPVIGYYEAGELGYDLLQTVSLYLMLDPAAVTRDSNLVTDFDADELDLIELEMALEETFEVELPDELFAVTQTFGQLVDYLESVVDR